MAKSRNFEDRLAELNRPHDKISSGQLVTALNDRSNLIIAKAAKIAGEKSCSEIIPELKAAFLRLLSGDPVKLDKGCHAKSEIIKTLFSLGCDDESFYRPVLEYSQVESVIPEPDDTASEVRATAVLALAALSPARLVFDLIELLDDPEPQVRLAVVRGIGAFSSETSEALLRVKALRGDNSPDVTGECFSALLIINPEESPAFVAGFLESEDTVVCELAALALGESRDPVSVGFLETFWQDNKNDPLSQEIAVRALSLSRSEPAFELLFRIFAHNFHCAKLVVCSLSIYRHDSRILDKVESLVRDSGDDSLLRQFEQNWKD